MTRLFTVHPQHVEGEPYHLRLQLLHVPGSDALDWSDLKRVAPGETSLTFRERAR